MPTTTRRYCSIAAAASALVVSTVFGLGVGLAPPAGADTVVDGCTVVASPTPSDHTQCPGSDFAGADLADLDLSYADLGDSSFVQCVGNPETGVYTCQTADLSDSDLTDADLAGSATDFCEAVPEPSKVCATVGLDGADLEGADLAGDNLAGAGLVDADLEGADLAGVSFLVCGDGCFSADLAGADLTGTSLVPGDQAGIASGPSGAKASWRTPRALPGATPGACTPRSGSLFPVGATTVTCTVTDYDGDTAGGTFTMTILSGGFTPLSVSTTSLPAATVGTPYAATLDATGGNPPYSWKVAAGSPRLPHGLELDRTTGVVSGTPTARSTSATVTFEVQDTRSATSPHTRAGAEASLSLTVSPG